MPRSDKLDAIADTYAQGDLARAKGLREELSLTAGAALKLAVPLSPLERLLKQSGQIRIGTLSYGPIGEFYQRILDAFVAYSAFNASKTTTANLADLTGEQGQPKMDLIAGVLATPDRAPKFYAIKMPIMMGVNAITFAEGIAQIKIGTLSTLEVNSLTLGESPTSNYTNKITHSAIQPIAHEGEVGYLYARYTLEFRPHDIHSCDYTAEAYARELQRLYRQWLEGGKKGRLPVVFVDEWMCLKIYEILISDLVTKKKRSKPEQEPKPGEFPCLLMGRRRATKSEAIGFRPYYNLPICIPRADNEEWFKFISELWEVFVQSNLDLLVHEYMRLRANLSETVDSMSSVAKENLKNFEPTETKDWLGRIDRWLGLPADPDKTGTKEYPFGAPVYPWKRIIERTALGKERWPYT